MHVGNYPVVTSLQLPARLSWLGSLDPCLVAGLQGAQSALIDLVSPSMQVDDLNAKFGTDQSREPYIESREVTDRYLH